MSVPSREQVSPWALSCRSTAAPPSPTPRASSASPSASSTPSKAGNEVVRRGLRDGRHDRRADRPRPAGLPAAARRASSTCCSPPASGSRWRCWRWRSPTSATRPGRSPAARPASSPTPSHGKARIIDVTPGPDPRARSTRATIAIVAGFQGVSQDTKDITTLGRGGSDTTAVALAAALDADVCEIYTDVDGVFTADPRIVPNARQIDRISYEEMLEMAACGAKVLHLRCVEYARRYDMPDPRPLVVLADTTGTWVTDEPDGAKESTMEQADHLRRRPRPQRGQDHGRRRAGQARRGRRDLPGRRRRRDQHRHDRAERLRRGDRPDRHLLHAAARPTARPAMAALDRDPGRRSASSRCSTTTRSARSR